MDFSPVEVELRKDLLFAIPVENETYFDIEVDHDNVLVITVGENQDHNRLHTAADCKRLAIAFWKNDRKEDIPVNNIFGSYCAFIRGRNNKLYTYYPVYADVWPEEFNVYENVPFAGSIVAANCGIENSAVFGLDKTGAIRKASLSRTPSTPPDKSVSSLELGDCGAPDNERIVAIAATSMALGRFHLFALGHTGNLYLNDHLFENRYPKDNWKQLNIDSNKNNKVFLNDLVAASCGDGKGALFGLQKEKGRMGYKVCKIWTNDYTADHPAWQQESYTLTYGPANNPKNFAANLVGSLAVTSNFAGKYELFGFCQDDSIRRFIEDENGWKSPEGIDEKKGLNCYINDFMDGKQAPFTNLVVGSFKEPDHRAQGLSKGIWPERPYFKVFALDKEGNIRNNYNQEGYLDDKGTFSNEWKFKRYPVDLEGLNSLISEKGGIVDPNVAHKFQIGRHHLFTLLKPVVVKEESSETKIHLDIGPFTGERGSHLKGQKGYKKDAACLELTYVSTATSKSDLGPIKKQTISLPVGQPRVAAFIYEIEAKNGQAIQIDPKIIQEKTIIHIFDHNWKLKTTLTHSDELKQNKIVLSIGQGLKLMAFVKPKLVFEVGDPERDAKVYTSDMD